MQHIVFTIHIIAGVLFILLVLMQDKGVGFGTAIGGVGGGSGFQSTKRGAEKVLHNLSVFFAFVFLLAALLYVIVPPVEPVASPDNPSVDISDVSANATTTDVTADAVVSPDESGDK